jgi:hypothetical protein
MNGGDLEKGVMSAGLSMGTGFLGSEIADATGSDLAGQLGSNAAKQLITTGDINLAGLAGSTVGGVVGSDVAEETGSDLAGKAASSLTSSVIQNKNPLTGLINTGVGAAVNEGLNAVDDSIKSSAEDNVTVDSVQPDTTTAGGLNQVAPENTLTGDKAVDTSVNDIAVQAPVTTGGLNQLATADTAADDIVTAQEPPIDAVKAVKPDDVVKPAEDALSGAAAVGATALTNQLTSGAKKVATGALTSALTGAKPAAQPSQQQMTAAQISASKPNKPPAQVDVSKLTAIAKPTTTAVKPQFVAAPLKADVSKLTPIKSVTGLTSILNQAKQPG